MEYKNDKYKKKFLSWQHEEKYTSDMFVCLFVCLADLLTLFVKLLACSIPKIKGGLFWKAQ